MGWLIDTWIGDRHGHGHTRLISSVLYPESDAGAFVALSERLVEREKWWPW
jgi:hypothetical protein